MADPPARGYLTFTGPVGPGTRVWGAVLYAGVGATASLGTAAWLWGLRGDLPARLDVCVPFERKVADQPGVRVATRKNLAAVRHPAQLPPRTRVEDTVLDLLDQATGEDEVVGLITGACQRRLTTAARLGQRAAGRTRLRWRGLTGEVLDDVRDGVQSALERRWRRDVERAHGLPTGTRNRAEGTRGRQRYRDVRYRKYLTVVELDGNATHPSEDRELDRARDNEVAERAEVTLRYGWKSVAGSPCATAAQVGRGPGQSRMERPTSGLRTRLPSAAPMIFEEIANVTTTIFEDHESQAHSWPSRATSASSNVPS